jgi:thiamine biosynthesis lipoprotein
MTRLIPILALFAAACAKPNYETFNSFTQGTAYSITANNPPARLEEKIEKIFEKIDLTFSMFNPTSLTSRINRNETDMVTPLFEECFETSKEVHAATEGYFDPTVAPLVDAWGFGSGEQQEIPCVDCIMEYVGMDKVRIEGGHIIKDKPRVQLDFSSIAKGFTVDLLAKMLEAEGVTDYMVWGGGEARVKGNNASGRPWRIGIEKPGLGLAPSGEYEAAVSFSDAMPSIATSGNYRNWFVDGSGRTRAHIIDPLTGSPALNEILSVSIVAAECAVADAWATGIMASGTLDNARRLVEKAPDRIEYYIIYSSADSIASIHSPEFPIADTSKYREFR